MDLPPIGWAKVGILKKLSEAFAFNLRRLRGNRTQEEVAKGAKIPKVTYSRWEAKGGVPSDPKDRTALAAYFGVDEIDLFLAPGKVLEPTIEDVIKVISDQYARLAKLGRVSDRVLAILPRLNALNEKEFKQLLIHLKMIETARSADTCQIESREGSEEVG